ncbi:membrane bound cation transporter, putative [Paecilomyces variotii No. 5]|uniref:Membrane bound cation transporter, putative n=1 Tax=Byssochlamys spectabilis (strain No. 5 / NBRC 109023) TaxID=1356009 RepID=V5G594_BYSSN|nr:membrane bound cation transporter, putative [Paecilomyces variotii No. 5]
MNESSDEPPIHRIRGWVRTKAYVSNLNPFGAGARRHERHHSTTLPIENRSAASSRGCHQHEPRLHHGPSVEPKSPDQPASASGPQQPTEQTRSPSSSSLEPDQTNMHDGEKAPPVGESRPSIFHRIYATCKTIILSSCINWLLVCVPPGIALGAIHRSVGDESPISPTVVFAVNAIAIIPLASLLGYATECVASEMGDTIGALMNVTFGNAVELIIFIIALVANEIQIVQASLLGSILANLLLIMGMCFLFGGLRFREQLYNSTVTQMSACLLSLSVMSLLLPTAFHASFSNLQKADQVVLKVSRGTSVVLLLVYVLYLLFQLKSHAYIYESTPQHKIDEESHPGVLAEMLQTDSSSSDQDSDTTAGSHTTARRLRKAFRKKRRRSSNTSSNDTHSVPSFVRTFSSSTHTVEVLPAAEFPVNLPARTTPDPEEVASGDEADAETMVMAAPPSFSDFRSRDFEAEQMKHGHPRVSATDAKRKIRPWRKNKERERAQSRYVAQGEAKSETRDRPVDPADTVTSTKAPLTSFNVRSLSYRPPVPRVFAPAAQPANVPGKDAHDLRRTASLPDRLHSLPARNAVPLAQPLPHLVTPKRTATKDNSDGKPALSRATAIVLLLVTTGLVAACAEFLVDSIDYLVENTGVSEAFIGLIILPIVGNAAEHVTAVTVASKNKMDLAIGVAIGSSIQIALFVTPVVVLLGWCLNTEMSLYFSLFETISLFGSAFIVNYLMLDGRSNYLEGALLIAAYVIIAVAAFFYPSCENLSTASGPRDALNC